MSERQKISYENMLPKDDKLVDFEHTNLNGWTLRLMTDHSIHIISPNASCRSFDFDTEEEWETFGYEVSKETNNYIAVKKTDFVEFFQAMKFLHSYHNRNLKEANERIAAAQEQVKQQAGDVQAIQNLINKYEEFYNENKIQ